VNTFYHLDIWAAVITAKAFIRENYLSVDPAIRINCDELHLSRIAESLIRLIRKIPGYCLYLLSPSQAVRIVKERLIQAARSPFADAMLIIASKAVQHRKPSPTAPDQAQDAPQLGYSSICALTHQRCSI
jgi:hypothetical protein